MEDYKNLKIMVTGSSGTIGTALCEALKECGIFFYAVDKRENLFNEELNKKTIIQDLSCKNIDLPTDFNMCIHLAANARVYDLVVNPDLAKENFDILYNTLDFCRRNNVNRFIFASSREVYMTLDKDNCHEEDIDINHSPSPYAATKLAGELLIRSYTECYNIEHIILRFSNVYGKYDLSDRAIPLFISLASQNKDITIFGEKKKLDFTYIDDTIDGILRVVRNFDKNKNNSYNISFGRGILLSYLSKLIIKLLGSKSKIIYDNSRTGEVSSYVGNIDKAMHDFGFNPKIPIEEGVKNSINWYCNPSLMLPFGSKR